MILVKVFSLVSAADWVLLYTSQLSEDLEMKVGMQRLVRRTRKADEISSSAILKWDRFEYLNPAMRPVCLLQRKQIKD